MPYVILLAIGCIAGIVMIIASIIFRKRMLQSTMVYMILFGTFITIACGSLLFLFYCMIKVLEIKIC